MTLARSRPCSPGQESLRSFAKTCAMRRLSRRRRSNRLHVRLYRCIDDDEPPADETSGQNEPTRRRPRARSFLGTPSKRRAGASPRRLRRRPLRASCAAAVVPRSSVLRSSGGMVVRWCGRPRSRRAHEELAFARALPTARAPTARAATARAQRVARRLERPDGSSAPDGLVLPRRPRNRGRGTRRKASKRRCPVGHGAQSHGAERTGAFCSARARLPRERATGNTGTAAGN